MAGTGRWQLIAGDPVLDFVNTVDDRLGAQPVELLRVPGDLATWGLATGLLTAPPRALRGAGDELGAARRLRAHLTSLLDALVSGEPPPSSDLRALAAAAADAFRAGTLGAEHGRVVWRWSGRSLASVRHRLAASAADLLTGEQLSRLGRCPGDGCGWFFVDTTKRGNRRWCSMQACGQEAKSARRRAAAR